MKSKEYWILLLMGCVHFPVVNVTGSTLKLYDILSAFLAFKLRFDQKDRFLVISKWLFIIVPLLSLTWSLIFLEYPHNYYLHFQYSEPEVYTSLSSHFLIYPVFQLVMMLLCFVAIASIYLCDAIYRDLNKVLEGIVKVGTIISAISLFNVFVIDIFDFVPKIVSMARVSERSHGFFNEPGTYSVYATWIALFSWYVKTTKLSSFWRFAFFLNLLSMLLTLSTNLVVLLCVIVLYPFIFKSSVKTKVEIIIVIIILFVAAFVIIDYYELTDMLSYVVFEKISNFTSSPDHTMDSGSMRSFTTRIGIQMGLDNPILGVGLGNSIFHMYEYEDQMGIVTWGEMLSRNTPPQNAFAICFSDMGLVGISTLICFIVFVMRSLWKIRNNGNIEKVFLIGSLFSCGALMSVYPLYSLYLWGYMAMAMGYLRYKKLHGEIMDIVI